MNRSDEKATLNQFDHYTLDKSQDGKEKHQCAYTCGVTVRLWRLSRGPEDHTAETHYVLNHTAVGPHAYRGLMTGHRSSISYLEPLQLNLQLITR
ncbi:hypothetical protein J6590_044109 [Homalodisca vitripennis]|nr:hypothetical protein J6590_044109 [Homalodisca vitripennis]